MATLEEVLKLDPKSQLPHARKSKTVAPRDSTAMAHISTTILLDHRLASQLATKKKTTLTLTCEGY